MISHHVGRGYERVAEDFFCLFAKLIGISAGEIAHILIRNENLFRFNDDCNGEMIRVCI